MLLLATAHSNRSYALFQRHSNRSYAASDLRIVSQLAVAISVQPTLFLRRWPGSTDYILQYHSYCSITYYSISSVSSLIVGRNADKVISVSLLRVAFLSWTAWTSEPAAQWLTAVWSAAMEVDGEKQIGQMVSFILHEAPRRLSLRNESQMDCWRFSPELFLPYREIV